MTARESNLTVAELVPLLLVQDIDRAIAFYRDKLMFTVATTWEPEGRMQWCRLQRDRSAIMLQQACDEDGPAEERGRGVVFYFNCQDADAEYARLVEAGLQLDPPKLAFYGMNQLYLHDPDGYELCFQNQAEES